MPTITAQERRNYMAPRCGTIAGYVPPAAALNVLEQHIPQYIQDAIVVHLKFWSCMCILSCKYPIALSWIPLLLYDITVLATSKFLKSLLICMFARIANY